MDTNNQKKTQRGPRKSKKNKQKEIVQAIAKPPAFKKDEVKMEKPKIATPKLIPTKKGPMPHEMKKSNFEKANPWASPSKASSKRSNKKKQSVLGNQNKNKNSQQAKKKKPKPLMFPKKEQKKSNKKANDAKPKLKMLDAHFARVNDALSELQSAYLRLSNMKKTIYSKDKTALFLIFLFESFYPTFELNFGNKLERTSVELTKKYRQHIYQCVFDQFWSKDAMLRKQDGIKVDANGQMKFKQAAFRLRPNENMLSWKLLMNLPKLDRNNATQIGALYDMLGGIDEDMTPLKPWMEMMDFSFNEIYCLLLYLWFILDVELPTAPYKFIGVVKKKAAVNMNNDKSAKQSKQQPSKHKKIAGKKKEGKKAKKKWEKIDCF